jgi:hypothetical protein
VIDGGGVVVVVGVTGVIGAGSSFLQETITATAKQM